MPLIHASSRDHLQPAGEGCDVVIARAQENGACAQGCIGMNDDVEGHARLAAFGLNCADVASVNIRRSRDRHLLRPGESCPENDYDFNIAAMDLVAGVSCADYGARDTST